jgi:short-subunit dehydrogenase
MRPIDFTGRLVVVTGASSGLGREIARCLALREGAHLVITARRRDRLESLKAELESRCASRVHVVVLDLAAMDGPETLYRAASAIGEVFGLVNCAGITFYGRSLEAPMEKSLQIVAVNQVAVMKLTMLFLDDFLQRGSGAILCVTSVAAFQPTPFQNVYSATKHAIRSFMAGLAREYRRKGVSFSTFAPGGMATEMITLSGMDRKHGMSSPFNMDPALAARKALSTFKRRRLYSVPGVIYKTVMFLFRLAPRKVISWALSKIYEP